MTIIIIENLGGNFFQLSHDDGEVKHYGKPYTCISPNLDKHEYCLFFYCESTLGFFSNWCQSISYGNLQHHSGEQENACSWQEEEELCVEIGR